MTEPSLSGIAAFVGVAVGLAAMRPLIRALERVELFDLPIYRSMHHKPTPRGGGLIVLCVASVTASTFWLLGGVLPRTVLGALLATFALGALGLADDRFGLGGTFRLLCQFGIASVSVVVVESSIPVTNRVIGVFGVVAAANVFNFMDGIDGMAGVHGALFGVLGAWGMGRTSGAPFSLLPGSVAAGCLVFLHWNVPRARVFLGDCGAYAIPAATVILATGVSANEEHHWVAFFVAPWAAYAADVGVTLCVRILQGHPPYKGHRDHLYQRLVLNGTPPHRVVLAYLAAGISAFIVVVASDGRRDVLVALLSVYVIASIAGRYLTQNLRTSDQVAGIKTSTTPIDER